MVEWRSEKNVDGRGHGPLIFADFPFIPSIQGWLSDYLVPEQFSFYGVKLLASRPSPNLEDQGIRLYLAPTSWPARHGCPYQ
jgi:hypothetical protein